MWLDSLNATEDTKIYYNNSNEYGYYIGMTTNPTTTFVTVSNANNLYFPTIVNSGLTGSICYLASPSAYHNTYVSRITCDGIINGTEYNDYRLSVRPIIRLKADIMAKQKNGVWELQ